MRLVLAFFVALVLSSLAAAQAPVRPYVGNGYAYGPYVPLITTPQISLQSVSPNPVGARNATYGLAAGATNSTLSQLSGNTSSEYTQPVWFSGGTTPLISEPAVQLPVAGMHHRMHMEGMQREHERGESAQASWTYYASEEETASPVESAVSAKNGKRATRTYTNRDVEQENQKNGMVKYDGKTEQIK
jgi:hypothetical protein